MDQTVIQIAHVSKTIKGSEILSDVCLEMKAGRVYGIEGTNGSGKTMLMRVIAGLIFPTKGEIRVHGKKIRGKEDYPASLGMLIEGPAFLGTYTGFDNLKLLASLSGKTSDEALKLCLTEVGLAPQDKRKYKKFSLGMKQRLGIAAALMEQPEILILDEPINALDEEGVELVRGLIRREKERGALVILSCHDREFLQEASDELYQMKAGKLSGPVGWREVSYVR